MENTVVRVTKIQKLEAIKNFIPDDAIVTFPGTDTKTSYVFDHDAMVEFIDKEIAQLAKKNSGDKKPTETQIENEHFKTLVLDYLSTLPEDSDGVTCTQLLKAIPEFGEKDYQIQKVTHIMRLLKKDGLVVAKEVKGRNYFSLA